MSEFEAQFPTECREGPKSEIEINQELKQLLLLSGNEYCSDCNSLKPTWASINNGVFICTQCSGVHRSLGVEISFIQSTKLDNWTIDNINIMKNKISTQFVNENFLEYSVPINYIKPNINSTREEREIYIRAKYVTREFLPGIGKERSPPVSKPIENNEQKNIGSIGEIEFMGIVMIKLVSAKKLINADVVGLSDPYVIFRLGGQQMKSKTISNNLNPVWNEMIMFSWNGSDLLYINVWDEDNLNDDGIFYFILFFFNFFSFFLLFFLFFFNILFNFEINLDPIGNCVIDLKSLQLPSNVPLFLDLPLQDVPKGSIQVEITLQELGH